MADRTDGKYRPVLRIYQHHSGDSRTDTGRTAYGTFGEPLNAPTYADRTVQVIALHGLVGGGSLETDIWLSLNTPGTVSAVSQNSSFQNHTHEVEASSDPGDAETLLKTDENGHLRLSRLYVQHGGANAQLRLQAEADYEVSLWARSGDDTGWKDLGVYANQFIVNIGEGGGADCMMKIGPLRTEIKTNWTSWHVQTAAPDAGDLAHGEMAIYMDESAGKFVLVGKDSTGAVRSAEVAW